ncbi:Two component regulator propeller [Maribacter orientalis]|uniref:histidine kinase n=1 Tax=Maribacter orientalis TaxID=228957 RepID=A0A1H7GCH6_9FLAO|nr:ATP-binding protein [Maribacter orientalis]SEK35986.1 Two component regulator propeller [Maribacter orientalis]
MKNTLLLRPILLISILYCLFLVSCQNQSKSETETTVGDFKTPETIPLTFTEQEPFEWETITSDTLKTPVTYSLNVDALPSKPFALNDFKPLKSPMKEFDMDWENYPTEQLKFDSVPFTVTTAPIKKPTITKMKPPGIMEGTNANLLQLSTNEGLTSNLIKTIIENKDGTTWIGTSQSLILYDGENSFSYDYTNINDMVFDDQGRLWLATFRNGLYVLDFKKNVQYTINVFGDQLSLVDILYDQSGVIYLSSYRDGIYSIDTKFENLKELVTKGTKLPLTLFEDHNENIWLSFEGGIGCIGKERHVLKFLPENLKLNFALDIKEDASGTIWICSPEKNEVLNLSLQQKKARTLTKENGYDIEGTRLQEDENGRMWIAANEKVFILSENRNSFKSIFTNSKIRLNGRGSILKRKDGSIWIGTLDKGIIMTNQFTLKTEYFDTSRGLINDQVWEIEEDSRGELWLGTNNGINIIDIKNNSIKAISTEQLNSRPNNTINFIKEISKDIYFLNTRPGFSILDRQKNTITHYDTSLDLFGAGISAINEHTFAIYTNQGLFVYDIKDNTLKKVVSKNDPDILKAGSGSVMVYDEEALWIPTTDGLAKVNLKTNSIYYLREEQGLIDNDTNAVLFSEEGELWVATLNGMAVLNLKENTLTNLKQENGLIPAELFDVVEKGKFMYAASLDGLIPIEKATFKTTNKGFYTFNGGLGFKSNDYLQGSPRFLKNGQFWSGAANPSSVFKLLVLDAAPQPDSLESSVFITNLFVMDENPGFNEKTGIDSLNNKVSSYAIKNNITWNSIKHPYSLAEGLVLPFDQNSLSFSYASGDLFNKDQLTYRFILDGEDEDWTYAAATTKTKNYYNLKPGNYTFKVAARGFTNTWSVPDELSFTINPPWWQTWWAYLLFGLLFVGAVWSFVSYRSRWLKKENRILEESVAHRTSQLKNKIDELKATQSQLIQSEKMASLGELTAGIAHEIQNPLNFVNNFSEVNKELLEELEEEIEKGNYDEVKALAKDVSANEDKIIFHGKRADGIVKGMLQHSRSSTGQKEMTDINTLSDEYLRLAYHGLRAKDKSFNATLNTDFDNSIDKINIVPQDMGRVILNLITNAFYVVKKKKEQNPKGYEPTVSVSTKKQGNMALIKVSDNGNGVPKQVLDKIFQPFFTTKPSGEGTGLGLSLSYDIVKVHGGELTVDTKQGEGTTFTISLPMN